LVADSHVAMRHALRDVLRSHPDVEVVGEAADCDSALHQARQLKPDIVLLDVTVPAMDGWEAVRRVKRQCPGAQIVALSVHCFGLYARKMLKAGASAYVLKDGDAGELLDAIEAALAGRTYISKEVAASDWRASGLAGTRQLSHAG